MPPQKLHNGQFEVTVLETGPGRPWLEGEAATLRWADVAEARMLSGGSNLALSHQTVEKVVPAAISNDFQPRTQNAERKRMPGETKHRARKKRRKGRASASISDSPHVDILSEFHDLIYQRKIDLLHK